MEDLTEYYNDTSREVLELLDYHERCWKERELSDQADPIIKKQLEALHKLKNMVIDGVRLKKDYAERLQKRELILLKDRSNVTCPNCDVERFVRIVREEYIPDFDVTCDIVECTVCGQEFINSFPNNWRGRLIFFDYHIEALTQTIKERKKYKLRDADVNEYLITIEQFKKAKNGQLNLDSRSLKKI